MEFNLSTFALEVINFLILIWILQRLFYKPLLAVIAKRKQSIDQSLAEAQLLRQQANEQCNLYENRQKLWEQEKQSALNDLQRQLEIERGKQMEKLSAELDQERRKFSVSNLRQQQELQEHLQKQALQQGAKFAALLLQQTASPELEARLIELLMARLAGLPEACQHFLQTPSGKKSIPIKITSAFGLNPSQQQLLETKLSELSVNPVKFQYAQQAELIAGLRVDIGAWVLNANLQHELVGFAELTHESQ